MGKRFAIPARWQANDDAAGYHDAGNMTVYEALLWTVVGVVGGTSSSWRGSSS